MGRSLLAVIMSYELFGLYEMKRSPESVTFYVMGANETGAPGNYWTTLHEFPAYTPTSYFFQADGSLSLEKPDESLAESTTYTYDPSNPIPSNGGNNLEIPCGPFDQREMETRDDVLVFTTPVLADDVVMTGPIAAQLYVSSSAIDTDFIVKITDVFPDGYSHLLEEGAIRMRWRSEGSEPEYMVPGEIYPVHVSLWNISYVIPKGHQLRATVTSSNYPRYSVNANNGNLLSEGVGELIVAQNTLFHSAEYPSHLILPIVDINDMPEYDIVRAIEENQDFADKVLSIGDNAKNYFKFLNPGYLHN